MGENPPNKGFKSMSQDETKAVEKETQDAATEQEKEVEKGVDETTDQTSQEDASTGKENEIDYEAELARVTKERDNYKTGMLIAKDKLKGKAEKTVDEAIEETPGEITVDEFEKKLETKFKNELQTFKMEQTRDLVDASLESLTDNPKERELIKFHYENSLNHSGYTQSAIKSDLESAQLLANRSKILAENRELKEALKSKGSISNSGRGSNQDKIVTEEEPKFTSAEMVVIERQAAQQGLSVKEYIRRNKSKLLTE